MAREQLLKSYNFSFNAGVAKPLWPTQKFVTSLIIQNTSSNVEFLFVGDATEQWHGIAPGKDLSVDGDKLDLGTQGYVDLNKIYIYCDATWVAHITYLERF